MLYLASPYSHPDHAVCVARFEAACRAAAWFFQRGTLVFSPIAHSHPIAEIGELCGDWRTWRRFDMQMVLACKRLLVLQLDGWEKSAGVTAEMDLATVFDIPIDFIACDARGIPNA